MNEITEMKVTKIKNIVDDKLSEMKESATLISEKAKALPWDKDIESKRSSLTVDFNACIDQIEILEWVVAVVTAISIEPTTGE